MGNPKEMGRRDGGWIVNLGLTAHGVGHPFGISQSVRSMIRRGRFGM